jgi:hypothetical protein
MLQASINSFQGDTSKLAALIRGNLHPVALDPSTPSKRKLPDPKRGEPSQ